MFFEIVFHVSVDAHVCSLNVDKSDVSYNINDLLSVFCFNHYFSTLKYSNNITYNLESACPCVK